MRRNRSRRHLVENPLGKTIHRAGTRRFCGAARIRRRARNRRTSLQFGLDLAQALAREGRQFGRGAVAGDHLAIGADRGLAIAQTFLGEPAIIGRDAGFRCGRMSGLDRGEGGSRLGVSSRLEETARLLQRLGRGSGRRRNRHGHESEDKEANDAVEQASRLFSGRQTTRVQHHRTPSRPSSERRFERAVA